jgi:hypothetical protein
LKVKRRTEFNFDDYCCFGRLRDEERKEEMGKNSEILDNLEGICISKADRVNMIDF